MDARKKLRTRRYIIVFFLTTAVFVLGLIIGSYNTEKKLSNLVTLQEDLKTHTLDAEMQYSLLAQDPCSYVNVTSLTDELYDISLRLDYMENVLGTDNEDVIRLKQYYSLLELRHWGFLKKVNKECGRNDTLVLYFYSNQGDCSQCEQQGFILSYLRKIYPNLYVYSFDINLKSNALDVIKRRYKVHPAPFIILNEIPHTGFIDKDELQALINHTVTSSTQPTSKKKQP
ncbi:MAG TPA: hypothetical protein VJG90_04935 [Candidatus Nanoarchaeia archaeon]|nr:hypothetical protein [Candidatus Nanoarchaeia archaeon]